MRLGGRCLFFVLLEKLRMVYYPQSDLLVIASSILVTNTKLLVTMFGMFNKLSLANGLGLAGVQVNLARRVFLLGTPGVLFVLLNPKILQHSSEAHNLTEGCLSVPHVYRKVLRSKWVIIRSTMLSGIGLLDMEAKVVNRRFAGMCSACFQHELDHLDGKLIIQA